MADEYYIIHRKVLPEYFDKVIEIKDLISKGENISDACRQAGLSRSTFYKYKDYVNRPTSDVGKRVIISLKLNDQPGALSNVLNEIASKKANILTINQEVPIHNIAFVTISVSLLDVDISIQGFVSEIRHTDNVIDCMLVAVE